MGKPEGKVGLSTGDNNGNGLGIVDGRLTPCPNKPNCGSSQAAVSDKQHYVQELTYSGEPAQARERIERAQKSSMSRSYLQFQLSWR